MCRASRTRSDPSWTSVTPPCPRSPSSCQSAVRATPSATRTRAARRCTTTPPLSDAAKRPSTAAAPSTTPTPRTASPTRRVPWCGHSSTTTVNHPEVGRVCPLRMASTILLGLQRPRPFGTGRSGCCASLILRRTSHSLHMACTRCTLSNHGKVPRRFALRAQYVTLGQPGRRWAMPKDCETLRNPPGLRAIQWRGKRAPSRRIRLRPRPSSSSTTSQ
mmetsp:Transcript_21954/g.66727  ORF Transcript_21954/g.66727 Transcript_21954/m.66727 type:complete len:218 (+) Transcript_21954:1627-2280(+)